MAVKLKMALVYTLDVPAVKNELLEGGEARYGCCHKTEAQGHADACAIETRALYIEKTLERIGVSFERVERRDYDLLARAAQIEVGDRDRQWLAEFLNHAPHIDPHDDEEAVVSMLAPFAALIRTCVEERDRRASMDKQPGDFDDARSEDGHHRTEVRDVGGDSTRTSTSRSESEPSVDVPLRLREQDVGDSGELAARASQELRVSSVSEEESDGGEGRVRSSVRSRTSESQPELRSGTRAHSGDGGDARTTFATRGDSPPSERDSERQPAEELGAVVGELSFGFAGGRSGRVGEGASAQVSDPVNHPAHYCSHPAGIECVDVNEHMTANIAAAVKYVWRAGLKPDESHDQDLAKAVWYIERERVRVMRLGR